jgi:hypothetical protein
MFSHRSSFRRRQAPRGSSAVADPRSGAPLRREPAPMPRMRWYR